MLLADQLESIYTPEVPVGDGSDADYALVKKLAKIATTQYNGRVHTVLKVSPKQAYMQRTTVRESNMVVDDINEHLEASVNLNNLFDREYYSMAGLYGTYGAPRNVMTNFTYRFWGVFG